MSCIRAILAPIWLRRTCVTEECLSQAPPVIEFDPEGNVVNFWGDPNVLPNLFHGCMIDHENDVWLTGAQDAIVQKYSHDGSKLLLQIGTKGVYDSSDGTIKGKASDSSHRAFFKPSGIAIDPVPGDAFVPVPHCFAVTNEGQVYVCDRRTDRLEVFDRVGNFPKDILINFEQRSQDQTGNGHMPGLKGSAAYVSFSRDQTQKFMYVINEGDKQVEILGRNSGQILSSFGLAGHQIGEFTHAHNMAVDSEG
jgi:DNA-binding beta-propeller fold protein YncE